MNVPYIAACLRISASKILSASPSDNCLLENEGNKVPSLLTIAMWNRDQVDVAMMKQSLGGR